MKKKLLLIRLDKIGDLICTLCVDQIPEMQDYEASWVIAQGVGFVASHAQPSRQFIEFKKNKSSTAAFVDFLKKNKPDMAVSFQAPWWVHYALWKVGVPVRVGVRSQWHTYLFLNHSLRQKRSLAIKHEADYNRELLEFALGKLKTSTVSLTADGSSPQTQMPTANTNPLLQLEVSENSALLTQHGLIAKNYIVVHAGMAGSALNWPTEHYIALITKITQQFKVVLTGTAADEKWLGPIKKYFIENDKVLCLQNKLSTLELLQILKSAHTVIAPSTGVAHLSASLQTPLIGIYPPVRVQHPRRWAARGKGPVHIVLPSVECPATFKCLKQECVHFDCMSKITPQQIFDLI